MVDYYFDKGSSVLAPRLIDEIKSPNMNQNDKKNLVRGILSAMKPVNKVFFGNSLYFPLIQEIH